jgi:hypothetical protein
VENADAGRTTVKELLDDYLNGTVRPLDNTPPIEINGRILHAIMGMSDEAGEMTSLAKKVIFYQQELDFVNLLEEMGDIFWYWTQGIDEIAKELKTSPARVFDLKKGTYNEEGATKRDLAFERRVLEAAMEGRFLDGKEEKGTQEPKTPE